MQSGNDGLDVYFPMRYYGQVGNSTVGNSDNLLIPNQTNV